MKSKSDQNNNSFDESKNNFKFNINKFEYDLYHDNLNTVEKVIQVKKNSSSKTDKWKILENNKVLFSIDGEDLSIKEREFLKTVEGFQLLINLGKTGFKSIKSLKSDIKHLLSSK